MMIKASNRGKYENTVLPAARQYLLPSKAYADLLVESKSDLPTVEKSVYDAIVERRAGGAGR